MPNIETLLRDHVTLNVDCIDRLYLNGYVPRLQRPENLWWFLTQHRRWPVPSPVDSNDDLRRAWLACDRALDSAITEARIAA
jgi:hypothetical protein